MRLFAQELTRQAGVPVGEALRRAKQRYLGGVPSDGFGTYDEKVLIETTLYGLPMYQVTVPKPGLGVYGETSKWVDEEMGGQGDRGAGGQGSMGAEVRATASGTTTISLSLSPQLVTTAEGDYYTVDGETQASPGRPVQPIASVVLSESYRIPHGALFESGNSTSVANFNPLVARPVTDTALSEPAYAYPGWYPLKPFTVNRLGEQPQLVVVPAQYYGNEASGVERLFGQMDFTVYYAWEGEDDFLAPDIWQVEGLIFRDTATFQVQAEDDSGVERVVVTYSQDGGQWQSADLTYDSLSGLWGGELVGLSGEVSYFIQAVDGAGNVSLSANKGLFFEPEERNVYLPLVLRSQS